MDPKRRDVPRKKSDIDHLKVSISEMPHEYKLPKYMLKIIYYYIL